MQGSRVKLTYDDYCLLPDDGRRYELHDGELSVCPAPGSPHQIVSGNLYDLLRHHVRSRGLGLVVYSPLDCILSETTVLQPDLLFVDTARLALVTRRGMEGPPNLVVEIVSPSTTSIDRRKKRRLYARYGVPNYWIVDPDARTFEGFVLAGTTYRLQAKGQDDETIRLPPFPDLAVNLATLWA